MVYHRWKDMLAGLIPNADWLEIRRVSWWMGWMAGMLLGLNSAVWIALVNGLFGFMLAQGWSHYRNRRVDRRHVYKGVSIPAFLTKSPAWRGFCPSPWRCWFSPGSWFSCWRDT